MLFRPRLESPHDRLRDRIERARAVTRALVSDVADTCTRIAALDRMQARTRIDRLIASQAWTDAALALVELELPQWKLRRLLYEDGEWHCCLSRQPELPAWTDETVEVHHQVLPLAILSAFAQARDIAVAAHDASRTVPLAPPAQYRAVCCDNFA